MKRRFFLPVKQVLLSAELLLIVRMDSILEPCYSEETVEFQKAVRSNNQKQLCTQENLLDLQKFLTEKLKLNHCANSYDSSSLVNSPANSRNSEKASHSSLNNGRRSSVVGRCAWR